MGALTTNWKRDGECVRLNKRPSNFSSANIRVSKKSRFSETNQNPGSISTFSFNSAVSRFSLYPEANTPFFGRPHVPCTIIKPGLSRLDPTRDLGTAKENSSAPNMLNSLLKKFYSAKQSALAALRYLRKSDSDSKEELKYDEVMLEEVVVSEDDKGVEKTVEDRNLQACSPSMVVEINDDSLAVESAENLLNSLSLDGDEVDVSGVAAYKKLLESAERRDSKLESLGFEIELNRKKCRAIRQLQTLKTAKERTVKELFTPLSKDDEAEVKRAFASSGMIVASHEKSNIEITGKLLQCLAPLSWLNDEVINLYIELLKERENREPKKFLKCHFFNTFFYKKLVGGAHGYNYTAVRRWTSEKKLGYSLSSCDKIFVPIHKEVHWCLAVISNKDQKFHYLDSLKGNDHGVLSALARYYVEEVKDKNGEDIDVSNWEKEVVDDFPEQTNGSDCGMFILKYMDFYSRGLGLCFDQRHMPYFRLRTAKEILRLRAD